MKIFRASLNGIAGFIDDQVSQRHKESTGSFKYKDSITMARASSHSGNRQLV